MDKLGRLIDSWMTPTVLLFLYGLFKELRPHEPYITVYLTTVKNFTSEEVMGVIYPVGTYATMALTVVIFLITDALLYRPLIILQSITCILLAVLLIVGKDIIAMVMVEIVYGLLISCDVAYLTYLYATVSPDKYPQVSALCRIAHLLGRTLSGLVGQVMISAEWLTYLQLHYLGIVFGSFAFGVAVLLPRPTRSMYFHRMAEDSDGASQGNVNKCRVVARHIKNDLRAAYTQPYVLAWSLWWALATCIYLQVLSLIQVLWLTQTSEASDQRHNGYVEVVYTLLGSGASWFAARLVWQKQWKLWTVVSLVGILFATLIGGSLYFHQIIVEYCLYVVYGALYFAALTVASSEVAQHVLKDSSGLIFGVNTFVALVLQSILTTVITSEVGLALPIRTQFIIYAVICVATSVGFVVLAMVTFVKKTPVVHPVEEPINVPPSSTQAT